MSNSTFNIQHSTFGSPLAEAVAAVRTRIAAAEQRAGRVPGSVRLLAVSKTHAADRVAQVLAAGITDFGENRVQESEPKIAALADQRHTLTWHLIGHLQRNKARRAAVLFDYIHSVDSLALALALDRAATMRTNGPLPILLQVNVSGERSKEGFALAGWEQQPALLDAYCAELSQVLALANVQVRGLMTIAPWGSDPEQARPHFASCRRLRDELMQRFPQQQWAELSMGMTDDYEVAIEEGASIVRVGRALFGARQ